MRALTAALMLAASVACYGNIDMDRPDPTEGRVCVFNREWSRAVVEVRIREYMLRRLRLDTMQKGCATVDRLPEQVYFRVRLLAQSERYDSEPVLLAPGQVLWLEIEHRPTYVLLWVTIR